MDGVVILVLLGLLASPVLLLVGARVSLGALGYRQSSAPNEAQVRAAYRSRRASSPGRASDGAGGGSRTAPAAGSSGGYEENGRAGRKPSRPTKWSLFGKDIPGEMIVVVAGPGSGKNQTILRPAAFEILALRDQHLILSDAKVEELPALVEVGALEDAYRYTFDPDAPFSSATNPVGTPADAAAFLGAIYSNPNAKETFWQDSALDLALAVAKATGYRSLLDVYDALRSPKRLDELAVQSGDVDVSWAQQEEKTRNNIRATALAPLSPLRDDHVRRVFLPGAEQPEFGPERRDVVVIEPPVAASSAKALGPLLGGLVDHLYRKSIEGYRRGGPGSYLLVDEAASVMKVDNLANYVNTGRGLGQNLMIVLQDLGQLEAKVGQGEARSVVGSCDIRIFGRTGDYSTAKLFSDMAGKHYVSRRVFQDADQGGITQFLNDMRGTGESHLHEERVERVTPEEVLGLRQFHWFIFATSADEIELINGMPWYAGKDRLPRLADPEEFGILGVPPEPDARPAPPSRAPETPPAPEPEAEEKPTPAKCGECGEELREGAKFCMSCGTRAVTPATVYCWQCGASNTDQDKECRECGESLSA